MRRGEKAPGRPGAFGTRMDKATRNGIYHNLEKSPYHLTIGGITYWFSSVFYMQKFTELLQGNREKLNTSLTKRFKVVVEVDVLCDLVLYTTVEKRGFLVETDDEWGKERCLGNLQFGGGKVTVRTLTKRLEDSMRSSTASQGRTPT